MSNHWNTFHPRLAITCLIIFLCYSLGISGSVPIDNQASKPVITSDDVRTPSRNQEIPIPADGDCLYKSIMIAYLLPVVNQFSNFKERLNKLIGKACNIPTEENNDDEKDDYKDDCKYDDEKDDCKYDDEKDDHKDDCQYDNEKNDYTDGCIDHNEINLDDKWDTKKIQKIFLSLRRSNLVYCLRGYPFSTLVLCMRYHIGIKNNGWGGPNEIEKIANRLGVTIAEYTPNPKDNKKLTDALYVNPRQKITLRIVQDHASIDKKETNFVDDNPHRQHYRALLDKIVMNRLQDQLNREDQKLSESDINIPQNLMKLRWSTSPYECAILSKHIYDANIKEGQEVAIKLENKKQQARHFPDWQVYKTYLRQNEGYKAVIYHNAKKRQIVLAYRGTKKSNRKDLAADFLTNLMSIVRNKRGYQEQYILPMLDALQEAVFSQKEGKLYGCTITGHSLGGWLAQLTRLVAYHYAQKSPKKFYMKHPMKVITFDSPGAKKAMINMIQNPSEEKMIDLFDITNYYSSPNLINCLHSSFGTRYRIVFQDFSHPPKRKIFTVKYILKHTFQSHKIDRFIESFNKQNGYSKTCVSIKKWPIISSFSIKKYRKLFNLISENQRAHIECSDLSNEDLYKALYMNNKLDYETGPYESGSLHERHIPKYLREKWPPKVKTFDFFEDYLTPSQTSEREGFWNTRLPFDTRCILDGLRTFQNQQAPHPSLSREEIEEIKKRVQQHQKSIKLDQHLSVEESYESRSKELRNIKWRLHADPWGRKCCIIYGSPGFGKSTLARLYGKLHIKRGTYRHVWWLDFTILKSSLEEMLKSLVGEKYGRGCPNENRKRYIQKRLYYLPECLLIIDNVPDIYSIKSLLPSGRGPHILITTRNATSSWEHLGSRYEITKLSKKASCQLLTRLAPPKSEEESSKVASLCKKLHYIPIVLYNVGNYIASQHIENPYAQYKITDNKLDEKIIKDTYQKIIDDIKSKKYGKDALYILTIMGYLNPYGLTSDFTGQISRWKSGLFKYYLGTPINKEERGKGVQLLKKYGILSNKEDRIHEITQKFIDNWLQDVFKEPKQSSYKFMHDLFPKGLESVHLAAVKLLENIQCSTNTKKSSLRMIGIAHARALMKHVQHNQSLCYKLLCSIAYLEAQAYPLSPYIEPQSQEKGSQKTKDLHQQVLSFIKSRHSLFGNKHTPFGVNDYTPLLLIKGEAGTGKSTYAAYLTQELVKKYTNATVWGRIPVFIFLPAFVDENGEIPSNLIQRVFASYGMERNIIALLQQAAQNHKQPFVFIMDSYDEAHLKQNIYTHCQLAEWGTKYSKFIITCRTNYLEEPPQATYYKQRRLFCLDDWQAREMSIAPFDRNNIDNYIRKFVKSPHDERKGKKEDRIDYYKKNLTSTLRDMAISPFMLFMLLLIIPQIEEHKKEKSSLYDVYKALTKIWLHRETRNKDTQVIRDRIEKFCRALAFTMWKKNLSSLEDNDLEMASFFRQSQFVHAPLRQVSQGKYAFLQPSYRDFFAAEYINHNSLPKREINQKLLKNSSGNFMLFLTKGLYKDQRNQLIKQCWKEISRAFQEKNRGIDAAYHLQLLYYIDPTSLQGENLSGINLQGGNLSGLDLTATLLMKANLSQINLTNSQLPKDLSGCNLSYSKLPKNLSGYKLTNVKLPKDLSECKLRGACLIGQDLKGIKLPKDLSGCNLKGANLSNQDLTGIKLPDDLSGCNLKGANLSAQDLTKVKLPEDLSGCNLKGANLSGQDLRETKLQGDLSGCNFEKAQLPEDLSGCNLKGANLYGQNIREVKLPGNLSGCNFEKAKLPEDLSGCNLKGANLYGQDLRKIKLPQNLSGCNFEKAQLPEDLSGCNLKGVNLYGQDLREIKLPQDLSESNLTGGQLPEDLSGCNLKGANLSYQDLTTIKLPEDLSECNLKGANLYGQDLREIKLPEDLSRCDLRCAKLPEDLSRYKLTGANLSGQDLQQVKLPEDLFGCNLKGANLYGQYLKEIKLPQDLSECNFTDAQLPKDLSGCNLTSAQLPKYLSGCDLTGAQLPQDLSRCKLTCTNLSGQDLREIKLPQDLSGCNLTGAQLPEDLSGCNLTGAQLPEDLSGYNLKNTNLSGQDLREIKLPQDLSGWNFSGVKLPQDLSGSKLKGAKLYGQNLIGIKLPKDLSGCNFEKAQLPEDLSEYNLKGANLYGQNLTSIKLPQDLSGCNFGSSKLPKNLSGCNLKGANLYGQDLTSIKLPQDLSGCNLENTQLPQDLSECNLKGANLYGQNFTKIKLPKDLSGCNLKGTNLYGQDLREVKLPKDLSGWDFSRVKLPKDLSGYNLKGAILYDQDLREIILPQYLSGCDLRGTKLPEDLSGCNLKGANLYGQDLREIKLPQDLSGWDLRGTKLPEDLSGCNLKGANLYGQDLTSIKLPQYLSGCNLKNAQLPEDLSECNLKGAKLYDQNLTKIKLPQDLSGCNLKGANLYGQDLRESKLPQDLSGWNFNGVKLPQDLSEYTLKGANLHGQDLREIKLPQDLSECNFGSSQLPEDLSGCNLKGANLYGQDFTRIKLPQDLSECNLQCSNLSYQDLTSIKLPKDLSGCNFGFSKLPNDLSKCNLRGANLSYQNLTLIKLPQDLSGCDLSGTQLPKDLSGCKLRGANLSYQNLITIKLPEDLSGCDLSGAQLPKDLSGCKLKGANLSSQELTSIKLPEDLSGCNFTYAQLPEDLSEYNLTNAKLYGQDLTLIKLPEDLSGCDLENAQLPKDFCRYKVTGVNLYGQDLTRINLPKDLSECNLKGANLYGKNLRKIKLPKNLSGCKLKGANLPKNLSGYNITNADLSYQNLREIKLPQDLSGCNLTGAQLPQDLSGCKLKGANLYGQDFTRIKLPKDLSGCNFGASKLPKNLSECNLKSANLYGQDLTRIKLPKDLSGCDLRYVKLPKDLSKYNLTNAILE